MKFKSICLVALFLLLLVGCASTDTQSEVSIEAGPTFLSGDLAGGGLILSERFSGKYEVAVGYVTEQEVNTCGRSDCHFDIEENIFVGGMRTGGWDRFKVGLGMTYWQNTNRGLSRHMNIAVMLEYRLGARLLIRARHYSNAGTGRGNLGQDALTIGWEF